MAAVLVNHLTSSSSTVNEQDSEVQGFIYIIAVMAVNEQDSEVQSFIYIIAVMAAGLVIHLTG